MDVALRLDLLLLADDHEADLSGACSEELRPVVVIHTRVCMPAPEHVEAVSEFSHLLDHELAHALLEADFKLAFVDREAPWENHPDDHTSDQVVICKCP